MNPIRSPKKGRKKVGNHIGILPSTEGVFRCPVVVSEKNTSGMKSTGIRPSFPMAAADPRTDQHIMGHNVRQQLSRVHLFK